MDQAGKAFKASSIDESILALSWNIATEPKLYRELAPNPYSLVSLRIISERFPNTSTVDAIRAVVLAEPEGRYDRNFRLLGTRQQEKELRKQREITARSDRLVLFRDKYKAELSTFSREFIYDSLSILIFETSDLGEIEQRYSQSQRRDFRLSIIDFIEGAVRITTTPAQEDDGLLRPSTKRLLKAAFVVSYTIVLIYVAQMIPRVNQRPETKKQILGIETTKARQEAPARLVIPMINVDATVEHVGITPAGAMDAPGNTADVGWYNLGPSPGERGSAVISGHFDGREGEFGVFNNLDKLQQGDRIYVTNERGETTAFVVQGSRIYSPGYADEVYFPNDNGFHLNLITCDGLWDEALKSYSKRLVVFADKLPHSL